MTGTPAPVPGDFESLFHEAPCGYLVTDDGGSIIEVNDTFVHWSGYAHTDLLGTKLQSLMPIGDQILYSTHCITQLGIAGAISEIAVEVIDADGERRAALLSASRSASSTDEPASVRVIIFSAHERRMYEKELVSALRKAEESEARRAQAETDLQHLAVHDALTGLPNRAGLKVKLDALLAQHPVGAGSVAALFVDLDHFKDVNDSLGHATGDQLLKCVAQRLVPAVGETRTVARLSGDEFLVVDASGSPGDVKTLATRLLDVVNAPILLEGLEIVMSASIGVAVSGEDPESLDELVRRADIAMFRAKALGRNRWEMHQPAESDPTVDRLRALGELRRGISQGHMRVHYQPRVDLRTGLTSGVEALVRWQHPKRGLLPPSEFITMAEESGLVLPLGAWVLDETLRQAASWCREGRGIELDVAVNLSARQLNDPGLVAMVEEALRLRKVDPRVLILEITETALMADPDAVLESLTALKELGIGLAVDDFGTGYSSLTYLKKFPVDELKIDRSFITGLESDEGDAAIVGSCIDLAHALGLRAVAEGVETADQLRALRAMGCDLAQGFHFARPLPAPLLRKWLGAHA